MKKLLLSLAVILSLGMGISHAQSSTSGGPGYQTALGIRLGYPFGITLKHFISSQNALEGVIGVGYGFNVSGLYEHHMPISGAPGLNWYVGAGLSFYSWQNYGASLGILGALGLDYKFSGAPIDLSLDWLPGIYVSGYNGFAAGGGGLGIRYTF